MSKTQKLNARKIIFLVLSLLLAVGMGRLGFWQLDRAEEKRQLFSQWQKPATNVSIELPENTYYKKVTVRGELDQERYFLLDNKVRGGRAGYEVLALLTMESKQMLLVNLGWVSGQSNRDYLPSLQLPKGHLEISGWVKKIERAFQLDKDTWQQGWPKRIQQIEFMRMFKTLATNNLQQIVLLSERPLLPELITQWKPANMSASKHLGYAAQWFLMAFVLCLMMIWFYRKSLQTRSGTDE